MDLRIELTDKNIHRLPFAADGQHRVRDTDLKGFFVVVGKRTKTYMVQGEYWRNGVRMFSARVKLGEVGDIATREARTKARDVLGAIARGDRPLERRSPSIATAATLERAVSSTTEGPEGLASAPGITLQEAWDRYHASHLVRKNRSAGTIAGYRDHVARLFVDWLDTPLTVLADDPDRVARRHDAITEEHGPYAANGSMRTLRAIYNHAWKKNKRLLPPDNPVDSVDWNPEGRRDSGMGLRDLPGWFGELAALENPIRREFHLFTLLSGCRPTALKNAELKHLDLRRRVLHIAKPKGGAKRAFDIPLSREMVVCLMRAMRYGRTLYPLEATTWLFPAASESGHLEEHKEGREDLSKWGNDLRQTFRTLAAPAGVSEVDAKLLMNHSLPGVNEGYITRHKLLEDHLRHQQQAISRVMFGPIRDGIAKSGAIRLLLGPRAARKTIAAAAVAGGRAKSALSSEQARVEGSIASDSKNRSACGPLR